MSHNESLRDEMLAEVAAIAPILEEHAAVSEKLGYSMTPRLGLCAKHACFASECPREFGGDEADPVTQVEVLEALARIDASASWVAGILAGSTRYAAAFLPARSAQRILATESRLCAG